MKKYTLMHKNFPVADLELDEAALTETLQQAGYAYQPERNQFLPAKR